MDKYEVTIKSKGDNNLWTMTWDNCSSFRQAERWTIEMMEKTKVDGYNEIIKITKDYDDES